MIAALTARLVASGVPQRLVRPILLLGTIAAACIILWLLWSHYMAAERREAVQAHDAAVNLNIATEARERDRVAADQRRVDDATLANTSAELERITSNEAVSVSDRRRQYYDRLRAEQAAAGVRDAAGR